MSANELGYIQSGASVSHVAVSGSISREKSNVTDTTGTVSVSETQGSITTQALTTGTTSSEAITVQCPFVTVNSQVLLSIQSYSAALDDTAGLPSVQVTALSNGTFDIVIINLSSTTALAGVLNIAYLVL